MAKSSEPIRVVVADSSAIVRMGLVAVLRHLPGLNVQAIDVRTQQSLHNYVLQQMPQVVIVNPMFDGVFNVRDFRSSVPRCKTKFVAFETSVVGESTLGDYDDHIALFDTPDEIDARLSHLLAKPQKVETPDQEELSQREREIVVCVVKGMTSKEIAQSLCLSIHTVITHRRNISHKLQIHSSAGLTIYAIVNKLVDLKDIKD